MVQKKKYRKLPTSVTKEREGRNIFLSSSSLDWYKLTESTRHVLNALLVSSTTKEVEESLKVNPNMKKIQDYQVIIKIVMDLTRESKNFESKERMQEILNEYASLEVI